MTNTGGYDYYNDPSKESGQQEPLQPPPPLYPAPPQADQQPYAQQPYPQQPYPQQQYGRQPYAQPQYAPQAGRPQPFLPGMPGFPPRDQPFYGASLSDAIRRFYSKYATFSGRASRAEYWWAILYFTVPYLALYVLTLAAEASRASALTGLAGLLLTVWSLGHIVPLLAVLSRRLHDTGRSAWWILIGFVPFGSIALLVFTVSEATMDGLRFEPITGRSL